MRTNGLIMIMTLAIFISISVIIMYKSKQTAADAYSQIKKYDENHPLNKYTFRALMEN